MAVLRFVFWDQLSHHLASLRDIDVAQDVVMFCETMAECTYAPHHKKKIAFLIAAMRHFAEELRGRGIMVRYITLDNPDNRQTLTGEWDRAIAELQLEKIVMTEPSEWRLLQMVRSWAKTNNTDVHILSDDRFLASHHFFDHWARGKKQLRMEYFYRDMRRKYNILMNQDGTPIGGEWNYDRDNRHPPFRGMRSPRRLSHPPSAILKDVLRLVQDRFHHHFGVLEPFHYALTHDQAMMEYHHFIDHLLPYFGDYQDAMVSGEAYLYHSLMSSYLNAGLLSPLEMCHLAETAYHNQKAPLNAVEGFIRQILGWREYIRGIYWLYMPDYASLNYLNASHPLPNFYWTADTKMFCVAEAVRHTRDHAYSHHIQRLMVTGNFALLAGLDVKSVQDWYLGVYSDAFEWVEMPNTLGMALFGDGGIVASKPYAASGKYIARMSNFCDQCAYNPNISVGEGACPFNALYWDFIARHQHLWGHNQRMKYVMATWDKFDDQKKKALRQQASFYLTAMKADEL